MSRTRAQTLALVNWRGVFYERYLLDAQVTALEGSNGAGKTTVMIAAYVVLLPDLTLLRFSNVGVAEASGGDKGLYGRLGEPNSPTYAVIDFELGSGERLLAGVHLERGAAPNLNLTAFIISGLADDISLQDLLLDRGARDGEVDAVPDLARLEELAALSGGQLTQYPKRADYFAELFARGVTPLRLTDREDRVKFNQMLHTSMVGGISQALTTQLREFIFSEETGLADTLKRMHGNLQSCRRTRNKVADAQRMEQEINGVYEAGRAMFAAAIHATRERCDEAIRQVRHAQGELSKAQNRANALAETLDEKRREHAESERELEAAKVAINRTRDAFEQVKQAHQIGRRIAAYEQKRVGTIERLEQAQYAEDQAIEQRKIARKRRENAQNDLKSAADGLADFQDGIAELHRRAAAFKHVMANLEDARRGLPGEDIRADTAARLRDACQDQLDLMDAHLSAVDRKLKQADQKRRDHAEVLGALNTLCAESVAPEQALRRAREILSELRNHEQHALQIETLKTQRDEVDMLVKKQQKARQNALNHAAFDGELQTGADVQKTASRIHHQLESARGAQAEERASREESGREIQRLNDSIEVLQQVLPQWRKLQKIASELAEKWRLDAPLKTRPDVERLHQQLQINRDIARAQLEAVREKNQALSARIEQLQAIGGAFSDALLNARDAAEGELLAGYFEDISVKEAGRIQARLGPLAEAIVVDDVQRAARRLAQEPHHPETIWLIDEQTPLNELEGVAECAEVTDFQDAVFVQGERGYRLSRIPEHPTLGRSAREKLIASLQNDKAAAEQQLDQAIADEQEVALALKTITILLTEIALFERKNPAPELLAAQKALANMKNRAQEQLAELDQLRIEIDRLKARRAALQQLLPGAYLLDLPDQAEKRRALEVSLSAAYAAKKQVERVAKPREIVDKGLDNLGEIPLTDAQLEELGDQYKQAAAKREEQSRLLRALEQVVENAHALSWSDAPDELAQKTKLRPALQRQYDLAKKANNEAQQQQDMAEESYESASEQRREVDAELKNIDASLKSENERFAQIGVEDTSDAALERAEQVYQGWCEKAERLDKKERQRGQQLVATQVRHKAAAQKVDEEKVELADLERQALPHAERWERLEQQAEAEGVLNEVMTAAYLEQTHGSVKLYSNAQSDAKVLIERLLQAEEGTERAQNIRGLLEAQKQESGMTYLRVWLDTRDWMRRRVPLQIAECDDPLEALRRLHVHLEQLGERLSSQESRLRGQSADVAHNIEIQRRKAQRQVTQLNKDLRNIRFGSIQGLRIRVKRDAHREQILRALRTEEGQQFLFSTEMPFEEAMANLMKRFAGGKTGGERLLDYREYMHLHIEVKRQASEEWEQVNPAKLSTGEAIGIGAAVMMVVLGAWERSATILRTKQEFGTLRFLFLDEANRLSQDNLGMLFELCEYLELQLLIAAPEVAQSQGNTTYHLVRQVDEDNREVVRVTGRRAVTAPETIAPEAIADVE